MARLEKFSGAQSLPGVGSPQVVADTAVGAATAGLGRQISQSADEIGGLVDDAHNARQAHLARRVREQQEQADRFAVVAAGLKLRRKLNGMQPDAQHKLRPGAIGLTEAMLATLEKERDELLKELPETARPEFAREVEARRPHYAGRFAAQEHAENRIYFQQGFLEASEQLVAEVRDNPDSLLEARREAGALLEAMPLARRDKAEAFRGLNEQLTEAFVETRPFDDRIAALESELARREKTATEPGRAAPAIGMTGGVTAAEGTVVEETDGRGLQENHFETADPAPDAGGQTYPSDSAGIADHLKFLPDTMLQRLRDSAVRKKTEAAVAEAERIAGRIADTHGLFDPKDIESNPVLGPHQKAQLINQLKNATQEQSRNLEAVNWVLSPQKGDASSPGDRDLADRAFSHLADGEADRDVIAREILRTKGVLPGAYVKSLRKGLESKDPGEVRRAYESLSALQLVNSSGAWGGRQDQDLQKAETRWRVLTDAYGLSPAEAAEKLSIANDTERRMALERNLESQRFGKRREQIDKEWVLDRLGVSGYRSGQTPIDDLLSGIEFIDRDHLQRSPEDEIRLAGGVNGLRAPGGVPIVGRLDPDKPTGFYGGVTPNEAAAASEPIMRLMLDLMDPASRASVLYNELRGKQGGKKASDSGKNEQHGDGGKTKAKAEKQVDELNAKLSEAKTRREKKKLDKKIQNINKAAQRAASGTNHSTRDKRPR